MLSSPASQGPHRYCHTVHAFISTIFTEMTYGIKPKLTTANPASAGTHKKALPQSRWTRDAGKPAFLTFLRREEYSLPAPVFRGQDCFRDEKLPTPPATKFWELTCEGTWWRRNAGGKPSRDAGQEVRRGHLLGEGAQTQGNQKRVAVALRLTHGQQRPPIKWSTKKHVQWLGRSMWSANGSVVITGIMDQTPCEVQAASRGQTTARRASSSICTDLKKCTLEGSCPLTGLSLLPGQND